MVFVFSPVLPIQFGASWPTTSQTVQIKSPFSSLARMRLLFDRVISCSHESRSPLNQDIFIKSQQQLLKLWKLWCDIWVLSLNGNTAAMHFENGYITPKPTGHFPILQPQNPMFVDSELHNIRRSTNWAVLKLSNIQSVSWLLSQNTGFKTKTLR